MAAVAQRKGFEQLLGLRLCPTNLVTRMSEHPIFALAEEDVDMPAIETPLRTAAEPHANRIQAIDILRALALFGVLAINLDTEFRVSSFEQYLPPPPSVSSSDIFVTTTLKSVFEYKSITLFSLLFGMGLAIQFEHLSKTPARLTLMARRLFALLIFGLIHLFLIWNGDILTVYAIAGFVVLPCLFASFGVIAALSCAALILYLTLPWLPISFGFPDQAWIVSHIVEAREAYAQTTFRAALIFRVNEIPDIIPYHLYTFPRTIAIMLFGALVWRARLIANASTRGTLLGGAAVAFLTLGVFLSLATSKTMAPMALTLTGPPSMLAQSLLPILLAIGYAALVVWILTCTRFLSLLAWAAPMGQTAFTNYLMQSMVLGFIFYGYGLGLMGKLGTAAAFAIGVTIYVSQVFVSQWWLRSHRFGPVEWLWRTIMYGETQPWYRPVISRFACGSRSPNVA